MPISPNPWRLAALAILALFGILIPIAVHLGTNRNVALDLNRRTPPRDSTSEAIEGSQLQFETGFPPVSLDTVAINIGCDESTLLPQFCGRVVDGSG